MTIHQKVLAERTRCLSRAGSSTKTEPYVLDAIATGRKVTANPATADPIHTAYEERWKDMEARGGR